MDSGEQPLCAKYHLSSNEISYQRPQHSIVAEPSQACKDYERHTLAFSTFDKSTILTPDEMSRWSQRGRFILNFSSTTLKIDKDGMMIRKNTWQIEN